MSAATLLVQRVASGEIFEIPADYRAVERRPRPGVGLWKFAVVDRFGHTADVYRSRAVAEVAARELNTGRAHLNRHAPIGCRAELSR